MRSKLWLGNVLVALSMLLGGCASVVGGSSQTLSVTTPGCESASCELTNDKGKWHVPRTPGSVTVSRAYADLVVSCSKEGFSPTSTSVKSATKALAFGNILIGGIIGAGIDMGTGAAYDYPSKILLPMDCRRATAATPAPVGGTPVAAPASTGTSKWKFGCVVENLSQELAAHHGISSNAGVVVTAVASDSVAAAHGIQVEDVLTTLNGTPITSASSLRTLLEKHDGSSAVRIEGLRNRKLFAIDIAASQEAI